VRGKEEGRGGEKGMTKERLDTRKITCAVYYAFPCNGSIIRVFVRQRFRRAIIRTASYPFLEQTSEESYKRLSIIFRTCESFYSYISSPRNHNNHFLLRENRDSPASINSAAGLPRERFTIDETKTITKKVDNLDLESEFMEWLYYFALGGLVTSYYERLIIS